jgi:N-acetylmuramic acid 6-phosphate etherase
MPNNLRALGDQTQPDAALATEQINPATVDIDRRSPLEMVRAMNAEDARVAEAVGREAPQIAAAIEAIAARMRRGGRLIYIGAGTSGRLGALDAIECPPTFNVAPERIVGWVAGGPSALAAAAEAAEDSAEQGQADIERLDVAEPDVVVGITASGRTPYALGALSCAQARGAFTIGLVCNANAPLARFADITIAPLVGPEVIAGSTRLKAGTAQKMTLNMLSTGTMLLLGKTFGNLMVDVQATNDKLRRRALGIVQAGAGLDAATAEVALQAAGGDARVAILASRAGIAPDLARERLAAHGGVLRVALDATLDATP